MPNREIKPFELAIVARSTARLTLAELASLRKQPPASFAPKLSPLFLKHSDEQTLAAMAALHQARVDFGLDSVDFGPWAIVSISRYMGRAAFATLRDRYSVDGAWGVSVQVIPHRTMHSVSGTISLGLGIHGPAIGVNGGIDADNTGLLSLACIMSRGAWQGVWLVCSHWSPEATVDQKGNIVSDSVCLAAALALVPGDSPNPLGYIRFEADDQLHRSAATRQQALADPAVGLVEYILDDERREADPQLWRRSTQTGLRIEVGLTAAAGVSP